MNISPWLLLGAVLAAEILVLVSCAALANLNCKSALWRQRIWHACFIGLGLLLLAEWSGLRNELRPSRAGVPMPFTSVPHPAPAPIENRPGLASALSSEAVVLLTAPDASVRTATPPPSQTQLPSTIAVAISWVPWLYLGVATLLILVLGASHLLLMRLAFLCRPITEPLLVSRVQSLRVALNLSRGVRLLESDRARGPLACGLFRPTIILPAGFAQDFEPAQQRVMLVHELAHLANRDPLWHLMADLLTIILWWHPAIWWARRGLQRASEAAADEASLLVNNGPETLAECLVTLGSRLMREPVAGGFGIVGRRFKSSLGKRVARLLHLDNRVWSPPSRGGAALCKVVAPVVLVLLVLWSAAQATPVPPESSATQEPLVVQAEISSPIAPPPDAPPAELQDSQPESPENQVETPPDKPAAPPTELAAPDEASTFYARYYKINLPKLATTIQEMLALNTPARDKDTPAPGAKNEPLPIQSQVDLLRDFLKKVGVDFEPPKTFFYNDRTETFIARATREELDLIEKTLQVLHTDPQQVTIEVRWCERSLVRPAPSASPGLASRDKAFGFAVPDKNKDGTDLTLTGILTPEQARTVMAGLQAQPGVDLLTAPKITTLSRRQAQIKVVEIRHIVTDLYLNTNKVKTAEGDLESGALMPISQPYELGPVLDIVPTVREDNLTIDLSITGTIKEFVGYDMNAAANIRKLELGPTVQSKPRSVQTEPNSTHDASGLPRKALPNTTPLPTFRVRQVTTSASVFDGQTLVLTGGAATFETLTKDKVPILGSLPLAGKFFRSEHKQTIQKELILFVTPRLIDPAGNPINRDEDLAKTIGDRVPSDAE